MAAIPTGAPNGHSDPFALADFSSSDDFAASERSEETDDSDDSLSNLSAELHNPGPFDPAAPPDIPTSQLIRVTIGHWVIPNFGTRNVVYLYSDNRRYITYRIQPFDEQDNPTPIPPNNKDYCTHLGAPRTRTGDLAPARTEQKAHNRLGSIAPTPAERPAPAIEIAIISAAPFIQLAKDKKNEVFAVHIAEILKDRIEEVGEAEIRKTVLEEYHDLIDVFLKRAADELQPHRLIDHQIILKGDVTPGHCLLYNMS